MRSIALGLGIEENFFDAKINEQCHNLRLLSYPPIKRALLDGEGQARAGSHSGMNGNTKVFKIPANGSPRLWDPDSLISRFGE